MWQMSSVFSREGAQRNDAGHLIYENVFKTTRSFRYQWFRVSTHQANANKPFLRRTCCFKDSFIYIYMYIYIRQTIRSIEKSCLRA